MLDPISIETALTEAEETCHRKVTDILGLTSGVDSFISTNGGKVECAVFDIGYPYTGETLGFPSKNHHWRAQLDLYSRNRKQIQKWLMRLVAAMPIAPTQGVSNVLDGTSNVSIFRIAPENKAIEPISTTELKSAANVSGVEVFTTTVLFDVVFNIGERG